MKSPAIVVIALLIATPLLSQEDHSEFIEGPFSSPQEVTETCLMCHDGLDQEIMLTRHWNWLGDEFVSKDGKSMRLGKQNLINNYCVSFSSNWARCTSCHIGYGWKDNNFDFTDGNNIDCLVCHDQTGNYKKVPTGAGMPDPSVDLVKAAQSVGPTGIQNCAVCHINGGGGPGVKHGDLTASMLNPSPELDVHMGGIGFTCADCHAGENHNILGASHGSMAAGTNHISCLDCHEEKPHKRRIVNKHVASVACETCHIPSFARAEPTKIWWDWSSAGENKTVEMDELGMPLYNKKKGDNLWAKDVIPEYRWYNGQADYYAFGDKINPENVVELNMLNGEIDDVAAKIAPFKLMKGKQIYDSRNDYLIAPKLFGDNGYWSTFNWDRAAELGMEEISLPYSGRYNFVETEMYWPINHMVAPASKSLRCTACHSRNESKRLDWEKLGYKDDPMRIGGRFQQNN